MSDSLRFISCLHFVKLLDNLLITIAHAFHSNKCTQFSGLPLAYNILFHFGLANLAILGRINFMV